MNKKIIVFSSLCFILFECHAAPVPAGGAPAIPATPLIPAPAATAPTMGGAAAVSKPATKGLQDAQQDVKNAAQALASAINNLKHEAEKLGSQTKRHISR